MKLWRKEPQVLETDKIPTLALGAALAELPRHRSPRVLDLGPACGQNVTFFSQFGCHLEIFDLYSSISDFRNRGFGASSRSLSPVSAATASFIERAKKAPPARAANGSANGSANDRQVGAKEAFDLILAWDLLDYISEDEIKELFDCLRPHRHAGTRLLTFVSYRGPIPARPRRYQILDRDTLVFDDEGTPAKPCPGFKEPKLLKLLGGFEVESCYLMRHGIQEYLFLEQESNGTGRSRSTGWVRRIDAVT